MTVRLCSNLLKLSSLWHATQAVKACRLMWRPVVRLYLRPVRLIALRSCSFQALGQSNCSQVLESKPLWISQEWAETSRTSRLCTCNTAVRGRSSYALLVDADNETDTKYPFPSPDWIVSNASWAAEQLQIYKENRTGKSNDCARIGHKFPAMTVQVR